MQLYARVRDAFGATTEDYMDTVKVSKLFGRRLLEEFTWSSALDKVNGAVQVQNTADTNMLSSVVAIEANKAAASGSLALENATGIVDSLVTYMKTSVSSSPLSSDYLCEVAGVMSSITAKPEHVSSATILPAVGLLGQMIKADALKTVTTDCAEQFYLSLTSAMSTQNILAASDQLPAGSSAQVANSVEGATFRIMTLVAKALIEDMSKTVSVEAATNIVARQVASSVASQKTYNSNTVALGKQKYTLTMPDMMQQLGLAATDLIDTVLEFNDKTPFVNGSQILSMGVGISMAKDGAKLAVSKLTTPIVFTVPLVKAAKPAPPGLQIQCE
jgi:hypothetical protein